VCRALIIAKKGLPKAIMVENEYGQEELDELDEIAGNAQPIKLNLGVKNENRRMSQQKILAEKSGVGHLVATENAGEVAGEKTVVNNA
jgi:hypothetical protein